jgi:hypothetical protein
MASRIEGKTKWALWSAGLLLVAAGLALPSAAQARGFVSFGFGVPLAGPPAYYYPPPAYYAPPAYYYPPPAPAPAYAAPPYQAGGEQTQGQTCREYQSTTTIDGRPQATYGTACLQPDGTWRIVN